MCIRDRILFVTGKNNYEEMRKQIHAPHVKVVDYVKQLDIMAHVDLIVCRAGATTAAEITALGTPSILVPSPYAVSYTHLDVYKRQLISSLMVRCCHAFPMILIRYSRP